MLTTHTLNGNWQIRRADTPRSAAITATVPGDIHQALLAAGEIPDPYVRDQEKAVQWVGQTDWEWTRSFTVGASLVSRARVLLRCHGLDTLATITLNGETLASTDNMYRTWEFDVAHLLRPGTNSITVHFSSAAAHVTARNAERRIPQWNQAGALPGGAWMRKSPCNFGWDWGPSLITCGIWRDIELVAYDTARLTDIHARQDHSRRGQVGLHVAVAAERLAGAAGLRARIRLSHDGQSVAEQTVDLAASDASVDLTVRRPALWWPNGLGEQPLYDLEVDLIDAAGAVLDYGIRRIGLRELRLDCHADKWGESFQFVCNGKPFFAKGANWIPADAILGRLTRDDYARLIGNTRWANMNMLRVWGGGIYEDDAFYELCDELGITVWQDFMFACSTYPTDDAAYMTSIRHEAEDNVRRLRHHACIAFWCGNNELEQGLVAGDEWTDRSMPWSAYTPLFDELLPSIVRDLDPDRDYWPGSPHSPGENRTDFNDPTRGDAHLWAVWHGQQPFEWYRTCDHRFNSEFGFQSFPEPRTVDTYTDPDDRNVTSFIMEHHQRSGIGNTTIMRYMLDWFRLPLGFDNTLWLSQIQQGMAMKYAVEHWRRSMPRGMGTLYWQLNDCWPVASWASIDSLGRYKALHYMARHFNAPIIVSLLEDPAAGTMAIHVTSDRRESVDAELRWLVTTADGQELASGTQPTTIRPLRNKPQQVLKLADLIADHTVRNLLVWAEIHVDGHCVADNFGTFARPKHLELARDPGVTATARQKGTSYVVILKTKQPALWTWLALDDTDARYSDNFIHLRPGRPQQITVTPDTPLAAPDFRRLLRVRSLADTW